MDIVIGKPLIPLDELGIEEPYVTQERNLAKIFVNLKVFPSLSQVRKNRPDLCVELNDIDCLDIKIGKRKYYVVVGE